VICGLTISVRILFLLLRHLLFPQVSACRKIVGVPSAFPCGQHGRKQVLAAQFGKGSLLQGAEPCGPSGGSMVGTSLHGQGKPTGRSSPCSQASCPSQIELTLSADACLYGNSRNWRGKAPCFWATKPPHPSCHPTCPI